MKKILSWFRKESKELIKEDLGAVTPSQVELEIRIKKDITNSLVNIF